MNDNKPDTDQIEIQKELLELMIKAGRRLMHDFKHMLNEVPKDSMFKVEFEERAKMWEEIFYPDNGPKTIAVDCTMPYTNWNLGYLKRTSF